MARSGAKERGNHTGVGIAADICGGQSDQTNNPSKNEVWNEVGLDVSHHTRISQRRGEKFFP